MNETTTPAGCVTAKAEGDFDRTSWVIAVSLAIIAAFINNVGLNLQKLAWTKKQSGAIQPSYYRTYWLIGMVLIVLASVFDFMALAFGPQSVIAPLGALTMVSNAVVAPWMHGEKLHRQVLGATLIIVIGCITAVASASHTNNICDIDSLFGLYTTFRFFAYIIILGTIMLGIFMFIKRAERIRQEAGEDSEEYMQKYFRYHRMSYACLSGIYGSQSVLLARSVSQMFVGSTRGGRIFLAYIGTYVIVAALVGSIFLQIYWLNQGLARFESLYNVPVFTSTWIVGTVLGGGIFYGEFAQFSLAQAFLFPLGVLLCVIGVFFLSSGGGGGGETSLALDEEEEDAEADGIGFTAQKNSDERQSGSGEVIVEIGEEEKGGKVGGGGLDVTSNGVNENGKVAQKGMVVV